MSLASEPRIWAVVPAAGRGSRFSQTSHDPPKQYAKLLGKRVFDWSLRAILASAVVMLTTAWLILAFTRSYPLYLAVYGLLLGPSMAITGSIMAQMVGSMALWPLPTSAVPPTASRC